MSNHIFSVQKHTLPAAHIREYPRATADSQEDVLQIAIKQYTPFDNSDPQPGDLTIIGAHANGFPKELYEPLWDELYMGLKAAGIRIRGIWIADVVHQNASSVINEDKLGNDPSWFDHPRDMFLMINHFRKQMPRPIIGMGHSMGGAHLVNLAYIHPRLFTSLILMDPVIAMRPSLGNWVPAQASAARRDRWPSRAAAAKSFKKSKFYQTWDPRVLDLWVQYGLRNLPTAIYPSATVASSAMPVITADQSSANPSPDPQTEQEVTLTTTKHQEVFTFLRPAFPTASNPLPLEKPNLSTHPDVDVVRQFKGSPFYRAEPLATMKRLPELRPSVLYVFGSKSNLSAPDARAEKMAMTGVGTGGSGGAAKGRVKEVVLDVGHLIPMEAVIETARQSVDWLVPELTSWRIAEDKERSEWAAVPHDKKSVMSEEFLKVISSDWMTSIGQPPKAKL